MTRPTVVCLCGSTKFFNEYMKANYDETMAGRIVLTVGAFVHLSKQRVSVDGCMGMQEAVVDVIHRTGEQLTSQEKFMLDALHMCKIDMADEILVLNVGGYIGESTAREIAYAHMRGKKIRYLVNPH